MRRRWLGALLVMLAVGGCGSQAVEKPSPSTGSSPPPSPTAEPASVTLAPESTATASLLPSPVPSPSASPLGVVRIPFARREMDLAIVGEPGVLVAWRAATDRELEAATWDGDDDITLDRLTKRNLVLGWIGTVCDVKATLTVAQERLVVSPVPREGCDAMAVGRGVVLTFAMPVDSLSIAVVLEETVLLPEESAQPPLNAVERWIEAAVARIGLMARVAEMSPPDRASMWVDVGGGRVLSIVTLPASAAPSDWGVVRVRRVAGAELRRVRDADGTTTEWIACGPALIRVSGNPPEEDGTLDAIIERLVPALDCG